jgi:hypothetical protein
MSRGPRGRPPIETGAAQARFVHFTGVPYWAVSENHRDPAKIDHVFITFHAPPYGAVVAAVNTLSRLNRDAGFDGRVRLGILHSHWEEKPEPGLDEHSGLSYAALERETPVVFEPRPHEELAALLLEKTRVAGRRRCYSSSTGKREGKGEEKGVSGKRGQGSGQRFLPFAPRSSLRRAKGPAYPSPAQRAGWETENRASPHREVTSQVPHFERKSGLEAVMHCLGRGE